MFKRLLLCARERREKFTYPEPTIIRSNTTQCPDPSCSQGKCPIRPFSTAHHLRFQGFDRVYAYPQKVDRKGTLSLQVTLTQLACNAADAS